jgi:hypothetical protein
MVLERREKKSRGGAVQGFMGGKIKYTQNAHESDSRCYCIHHVHRAQFTIIAFDWLGRAERHRSEPIANRTEHPEASVLCIAFLTNRVRVCDKA